jgi:hypothetical protein
MPPQSICVVAHARGKAFAQLEMEVAAGLRCHVAVHLLDLGLQLDRVHRCHHHTAPRLDAYLFVKRFLE